MDTETGRLKMPTIINAPFGFVHSLKSVGDHCCIKCNHLIKLHQSTTAIRNFMKI